MAKSTVRPRAASSRMAAQKSRRPSTSMPVVGSSRMSSSGSDSRAMANRSRCCSPPEHLPTRRSAMPLMPARSSTSSTGRLSANRLAVSSHGLGDGQVLEQPARSACTAETRPRAMASAAGQSVDLDLAAGRAGQAQDHVDGRGLAGPVGPEEGHDLARGDGQVDPPHGLHGAEALVHPAQPDGRGDVPARPSGTRSVSALVTVMGPSWRGRPARRRRFRSRRRP